ncbi:hypothetical protein QYF61_010305 [Mycteria americana]|uniref:Uncharacterized protein n=1 Tax=Mycteria americana TaxID=33587 RepID=A0AAN7MKW8_MYCAM|nr:hypothetical protein QYF61_010305 [Mycteria americana]
MAWGHELGKEAWTELSLVGASAPGDVGLWDHVWGRGAGTSQDRAQTGDKKELPGDDRKDRSCLLGEVPEDCKESSVNPALKKGKKEDLGSCQPVSSSILLDALMKYRIDKGKMR